MQKDDRGIIAAASDYRYPRSHGEATRSRSVSIFGRQERLGMALGCRRAATKVVRLALVWPSTTRLGKRRSCGRSELTPYKARQASAELDRSEWSVCYGE